MGAAFSCLEPARAESRPGGSMGGPRRRWPPVLCPRPPPALGRSVPGLRPRSRASCSRKHHPPQRESSFPPWNISVRFSIYSLSNANACPPPPPHSSASPQSLVLTSIKGEMMETIFMGMISIKYQLTWEPQPGVQCVKGKCTSHFHKACSPGKEGPRFALIMPGLGGSPLRPLIKPLKTHPKCMAVWSVYTVCPCPWAAPAYPEVQKPWPTSGGLL